MIVTGELISFNSTAYTAVVELHGSGGRRVTVPVCRGLTSTVMVVGRTVAVWMGSEGGSLVDAVLFAVWTP